MRPRPPLGSRSETTPGPQSRQAVLRESQRQNRDLGIAAHPASALDCAQSREASATGEARQRYLCASGQIVDQRSLTCRSRETRIARKDAMPHERGPIACAPIRILLHCSRRSQSSLLPLARQPLVNSSTATQLTPGNLLTLRHLTTDRATRRQSAWLCPGLRTLACHSTYSEDAPSSPAPFPQKTGMSRKDAQRIS